MKGGVCLASTTQARAPRTPSAIRSRLKSPWTAGGSAEISLYREHPTHHCPSSALLKLGVGCNGHPHPLAALPHLHFYPHRRGRRSAVERQLPKLMRYPSPRASSVDHGRQTQALSHRRSALGSSCRVGCPCHRGIDTGYGVSFRVRGRVPAGTAAMRWWATCTGTIFSSSASAASSRVWPTITTIFSSTTMGWRKPNLAIDAFTASMAAVLLRGFRA